MLKKFLIGLIGAVPLLFASNVNALTIDSGEYPDVPEGYTGAMIIHDDENGDVLYAISEESLANNNIESFYYKGTNSGNTEYRIYTNNDYINYGLFETFLLNNNNWQNSGAYGIDFSLAQADLKYTSVDIYTYQGEIQYAEGYGTPISSLFESVTGTIGSLLTSLATISLALLSNTIFQIMFGILVFFIVLRVVYSLVKKTRKGGK